MVFSSHIVATSHYEGKVHAKNLRKQGLQTLGMCFYEMQKFNVVKQNKKTFYTDICLTVAVDRHKETVPVDDTVSKSAQDGGTDLLDPQVSTLSPNTEVNLKDPNKYCSLCAATFNNPHMALQHYSGRKHQRNLSRQELLKGVEDHNKLGNLGKPAGLQASLGW